ncbi:hypothetical protein ACIBEJ_48255 [Nonomuraea sp. NPDC050790]|uniref:hypothetical protein n=1 Tax=Nonomuraea sp. NPDC050790 TaxID=3364371 RepID=UPI0037A25B0C
MISAPLADHAVLSIVGQARRLPGWQPDKTTWRALEGGGDDLRPHLEGAQTRSCTSRGCSGRHATRRHVELPSAAGDVVREVLDGVRTGGPARADEFSTPPRQAPR